MSMRLRFEPFPELPQNGKRIKGTRISRVQPYQVQRGQKELKISGREVKTMILMGYPGVLFPAFATELSGISERMTSCIHADPMDPDLCLLGIGLSKELRSARKSVMKAFLTEVKHSGRRIFNTCALISLAGLPDEVEADVIRVKAFCRKYLMSLSELDYQQAEAFKSTLPMCENRIQYNRVLTENNLKALLPWSKLQDCKNTVFYGEDAIHGKVFYNRIVHRESGFVLSDDFSWACDAARQEIQDLSKADLVERPGITVLLAADMDTSAWGEGEEYMEMLDIRQSVPEDLYWNLVVCWAVQALSVNGQTSRRHLEMVMQAAGQVSEERKDKEKDQDSVGDLCSCLDPNVQRILRNRPWKDQISVRVIRTGWGEIRQVMEQHWMASAAYAAAFYGLRGMVYSCNTERLAFRYLPLIQLHPDTIYTILTIDPVLLYEDPHFSELLKTLDFFRIGEHRISGKLKLSAIVNLEKDQRNWISEPAKGSLLITKLAEYQLLDERKKGEQQIG
jgi:hypothetical protein